MIRVIEYTAPVFAFVDTESEAVVGVKVDNLNEIYPTGEFFDENWGVLTEEEAAEALKIANSDLWPNWRLEV